MMMQSNSMNKEVQSLRKLSIPLGTTRITEEHRALGYTEVQSQSVVLLLHIDRLNYTDTSIAMYTHKIILKLW